MLEQQLRTTWRFRLRSFNGASLQAATEAVLARSYAVLALPTLPGRAYMIPTWRYQTDLL
jgi:hypothetical protein